MSVRQILGIFGTLAVLIGAWLVTRGSYGGADDETDRLDLAGFVGAPTGVSAIRIERAGGDTLRIERRDAGWSVNGFPADDSLVVAALEALALAPPLRVIARNASSHGRMGLTADSAARVRFETPGRRAGEILVGGAGRDGRFVRLPGADLVYVGPSTALDPLVGGTAVWRDFRIARVDTATLARIVIRRGAQVAAAAEREVSVQRAATGGAPPLVSAGPWTVAGAPADTTVMRLYVGALADLEATGFPADSFVAAADFERPDAVVELYLAGAGAGTGAAPAPGVTLLFSTGLDHPDILVRRADSPVVYAIDRARANLLTTNRQRLLGRL
jgi:hypothetical protein